MLKPNEEEKLDKNQLINVFEQVLLKSGFSIIKKDYTTDPLIINIKDEARKIELHVILKNIVSGGWKDKEEIKRVQIGNIQDKLVFTTKAKAHMICGVIRYIDKYILVVWNSHMYTSHKTNRSCYIKMERIKECYERHYCLVHDNNQEVWLCDEERFNLLVRDYISYTYQ